MKNGIAATLVSFIESKNIPLKNYAIKSILLEGHKLFDCSEIEDLI